ncbi:NRDE family protein [uncultured Algibacter sp.]|uniref:NRDE family protein n=1 Tax=uncultured Algibacter sp. TaxID=298659 RepID=UPI00261DA931|nr:NRDE family protein [uncultured Algibacter sp.]
MCTVTIIPKEKTDFILTSNRDEAPNRVSLIPDFYTLGGTKLLFPKDKKGGTWIGVSEKNRVVCVLNGALTFHKRKQNYRMSRGIVANDFMISDKLVETVQAYNLIDIEPFTMVIIDWNQELKFYELVWDGINKYFTQLPLEPRIWSSSTLYSQEMKKERQEWFEDFKLKHSLNAGSILNFHKMAGIDNEDYGVVMNRGFVKTTSITQIRKTRESCIMQYENLQDKTVTTKTFKLPQVVNE